MNKRTIKLWSLWGFAVTSLFGTLLHFLYDFSGGNKVAALFSGVNESTWEHMKLLFFPMLLFTVVQNFFFRDRHDFFSVKLRGTLLGLLMIPIIFYTYNGAFGKSPDYVNIGIFFVSAAVAYYYEAKKFEKSAPSNPSNKFSLIILTLICASFFLFTFYPPRLPIFMDPLTNTYGIQ